MKPALALVLCLLSVAVARGQSPSAFGCSGTDGFGYYISSASVTHNTSTNVITASSSRLSKLTTATGVRTTLCTEAQIGVALNALAFNPVDNYLYAVSRFDATHKSGKLYRLGQNCERLEIAVTGSIKKYTTNNASTVDSGGGAIGSGTFDQDGNYYVNTSYSLSETTGFTNKIQKIAISGNTATVVSTKTLTHSSSAGTSKIQITDIIYDENSNELLGSDRQSGKLYRIEVSTGEITAIGSTGIGTGTTVLGIYKNRNGDIRAIDGSGDIYSVNPTTGVFDSIATAGDLRSGNADAASGCYAPAVISGTVFLDANGLTDNTVNGTPTNKAGTTALHAVLIQATKVVASTPIASDGTYSFSADFSGNYTIRLGTIAGTVGNSRPSQALPATHAFVGDDTGGGAGVDDKANGRADFSLLAGESRAGINFGIDTKPVVANVSAESQANPGNTTQVEVVALDRTDAEDGTPTTVRLFDLPDAATKGVLYYNGTAATANQQITNFQPALFTFDPVDGPVTVTFNYAALDQANVTSNTATATMDFTVALPSILNYFTSIQGAGSVALHWQTASETDADYFAVQRSTTGKPFSEQGRVSAYGTSTAPLAYQFDDKDPPALAYYRLKLVDTDGSYTYSPTLVVARVRGGISVYPTVVTDVVHIVRSYPADHRLDVSVYSAAGRRVLVGQLADGDNQLSVAHLPWGLYRLVIHDKATDELTTTNLIKRQ